MDTHEGGHHKASMDGFTMSRYLSEKNLPAWYGSGWMPWYLAMRDVHGLAEGWIGLRNPGLEDPGHSNEHEHDAMILEGSSSWK